MSRTIFFPGARFFWRAVFHTARTTKKHQPWITSYKRSVLKENNRFTLHLKKSILAQRDKP